MEVFTGVSYAPAAPVSHRRPSLKNRRGHELDEQIPLLEELDAVAVGVDDLLPKPRVFALGRPARGKNAI